MSESSKHLHQQHTEARLFKERYKERFGPLQHTGRPSSTPLAKESRLLSKSYRKLDIKPASHFTETRAESVGFAPQFAIPKTNFNEQQLNPDHPENRLPPPHHFPVGRTKSSPNDFPNRRGSSVNQVWPPTIFVLFCEKSLICLDGKSMTPSWVNTILFRSSQQLPRLHPGPLKGFLS